MLLKNGANKDMQNNKVSESRPRRPRGLLAQARRLLSRASTASSPDSLPSQVGQQQTRGSCPARGGAAAAAVSAPWASPLLSCRPGDTSVAGGWVGGSVPQEASRGRGGLTHCPEAGEAMLCWPGLSSLLPTCLPGLLRRLLTVFGFLWALRRKGQSLCLPCPDSRCPQLHLEAGPVLGEGVTAGIRCQGGPQTQVLPVQGWWHDLICPMGGTESQRLSAWLLGTRPWALSTPCTAALRHVARALGRVGRKELGCQGCRFLPIGSSLPRPRVHSGDPQASHCGISHLQVEGETRLTVC